MELSAAAGLTDRVMDILNNTTTNTEPLPPIREALDTMMEHIDDKMTRLQLYHRVIDEIATALGYRLGQAFEPETLVKEVKRLAAVEAERDTLRALLDEALKDTEYWINRAGKLDATLAALREPSEAVIEAAGDSFDVVPDFVERIIRAAVEAAEKEVTDANR